jgi:hypothetical protein
MSYHTAAPNKYAMPASAEIVFRNDDGYIAYEHSGRLYLYKDEYRLAELISGYSTLKKSYRNSFDVWIHRIREKDLDKIETLKEYIENIKSDISVIASIHGVSLDKEQ